VKTMWPLLVLVAAPWADRAVRPAAGAELVEVRRIWDRAPHNAFTDLVRFHDRWFCVFREGTAHASSDGALRVLTSPDGREWISAALVTREGADLRDPKITVTPDDRLMLTGAAASPPPAPSRHQTLAWFSADGRDWGVGAPIGDPDVWLWRVVWHQGTAYGIGYGTAERGFVRLYRGRDGRTFETLVETLFAQGFPNESSLAFLPDETCLCLLRRDGDPATAQLGTARPPYTSWAWKDLGTRIGGPCLLRLPDGRLVAAVRLHDGRVRTALCWLDPEQGTLREFLTLPSGGDTSYAGLVWHEGLLWVSYYSSHEGKASIHLAKVKLSPP
jgi:hypothetical protein